MVLVTFRQDYEKHKNGDTVDIGRFNHACALVRGNIANWATTAEGAGIPNFTTDEDGLVPGPTSDDVTNNHVLRADGDWVSVAGHTGTTGSVFFAGAGGAGSSPTEDNDALFFDDTAEELYINSGTSSGKTNPATLYVSRDISTGKLARFIRSGTADDEEVFYIGDDSATPDLLVTGKGEVGIGEPEATLNAKLRVRQDNLDDIAVFIKQNENNWALGVESSSTDQNVINVTCSSLTTATAGIQVIASALTTGSIAVFTSASSSTGVRDCVVCRNQHVDAVNAIPLVVEQGAAGVIMQLRKGLSVGNRIFEWHQDRSWALTPIPDGSETDTAPVDDHTMKKLSLQKLASAPTNGAYIAFTNNPGAETFYLVLEESP